MPPARFLTRLSLVAGLGALVTPCSLSGQSVHVVDDDGGAGVAFVDIQAAINAAAYGDTILVRSGSYGGVFVTGKSVAIVADRGAAVQLAGSVQVRDVGARGVTVQGVTAQALGGPALDVQDCSGPVLVSDSNFIGAQQIAHFAIFPGARISQSGAVTLVRCSVQGGAGLSYPVAISSDGLVVVDSAVRLFNTIVVGGSGALGALGVDPAPGGAGLMVNDGVVHVQGGSVAGGAGGAATMTIFGCGNGAIGGAGAVLAGPETLVEIQGAMVAGGSGGTSSGSCSPGPRGVTTEVLGGQLAPLAHFARELFLDSPVREGQSLTHVIRGQAGDLAGVALSRRLADTPLSLLLQTAPLLLDTSPLVLVPIGLIPASGTLQGSIALRDLAPGIELVTWYAQVVTVDTSFGIHLGNAESLIILDSTF